MAAAVPGSNASTAFNSQNGYGSSGELRSPNPVDGSVLTMFAAPATAEFAYYGGTFDGTHVWFSPFGVGSIARIDVATGATSTFSSWPSGVSFGTEAFTGAVYDGTYVWLCPYAASAVVRVDRTSGTMTAFSGWPSNAQVGSAESGRKFEGCTFDGRYIWLSPLNAAAVVRLDTRDGTMRGFDNWPSGFTKGGGRSYSFIGALYDGELVWFVPWDATAVISINTTADAATGEHVMRKHDAWPAGYRDAWPSQPYSQFSGGAFDGTHIWLAPMNSRTLIRIHTRTGQFTGFTNWPSGFTLPGGFAFRGAAFDGTYVWLAPTTASTLVRVEPATGSMAVVSPDWPSGFSTSGHEKFRGAVYDGSALWLVPCSARNVIRVGAAAVSLGQTGLGSNPLLARAPVAIDGSVRASVSLSPRGDNAGAYGGTFDGRRLWIAPFLDNVLRVVDTVTGETSSSTITIASLSGENFAGAVYDGSYVWLCPYAASAVVRVHPSTGVKTAFPGWPSNAQVSAAESGRKFEGCTFDGRYIWLSPLNAAAVVRVDTRDGTMRGFDNWPSGFTKGGGSAYSFSGAVFDGQRVWFAPLDAPAVIAIDTSTLVMTAHRDWPSSYNPSLIRKFIGGTFDGTNVWFAPAASPAILKVHAATGAVTTVAIGGDRNRAWYRGAVFDGTNVWLAPGGLQTLYLVDPRTNAVSEYGVAVSSVDDEFRGCISDGQRLWLVPHHRGSVLSIGEAAAAAPATASASPATASASAPAGSAALSTAGIVAISVSASLVAAIVIGLMVVLFRRHRSMAAVRTTESFDVGSHGNVVPGAVPMADVSPSGVVVGVPATSASVYAPADMMGYPSYLQVPTLAAPVDHSHSMTAEGANCTAVKGGSRSSSLPADVEVV